MQDLYHSVVRTENSYIENISNKDKEGNELSDRLQELKNILKWVQKRGAILCDVGAEPAKRNSNQYSYFMIKIQAISNLQFKKATSKSKVYALLIAKLVNIKTNQYYPKVTRIAKALDENNQFLYQLRQPICLYFYTPCEADLMVKIEVLMVEQDLKSQNNVPFFGCAENGGYIEIDFLKEHKGKEKKFIISPYQFSFSARQAGDASANSIAFINFTVAKSEAYRYLERIISQHTLCDPSDKIAGIMGYYLPLSENALTDFALTPEAQALHLSFAAIQVNASLIKQATARAEQIIRNKFSPLAKLNSSIGDIMLHAKFHNCWRVVSSASSILKEKGDLHLKTNNSNVSEINIQTNRKMVSKISEGLPLKAKHQFKNYACENAIDLGLVFPNQEQCVIIYQLTVDVAIRAQMPTKDKKDLPDLIQEVITVPLCFGITPAKSIGNYRSNTCSLSAGGCLTSLHNIKDFIEHNLKQINMMKKNQVSKAIAEQKNNKVVSLVGDFDAVSNLNKTVKTIENISQFSFKNMKSEIGFLDFQMHLVQRQDNIQDNINLSLQLENFSSMNASKIDIKDKIQNEKQRIAKQSKKNIAIPKTSNKLDINFTKQFIISDHHKNQLLSQIYPPKDSSYYTKEAFLKLLKQQVSKNYQRPINPHFQIPSSNQPTKQTQGNSKVLYSINLSRVEPECIIQHKSSKYFYYLYSNYIIHERYFFKYEETPMEVIKTELSQANYNNCYFINFMEISNHINNQLIKFPKAFYFKMRFYNEDEVRSELMTVNKDTGEVLLLNNPNPTDKIIHVEVNIDEEPNNFLMKFAQFIQYLHNGVLNVQIVDYFTGLTFGLFTIPLRNLVRKRRNEVVYVHEDWIYHRNLVRGSMKVEMRAIRKMKHRVKIQNKSPEKAREASPAKEAKEAKDAKIEVVKAAAEMDSRMNRIQRFKQSKSKSEVKHPQSQLKSQMSQVAKIINKAYVNDKTKIMVSYLKKQFVFIEIANKHDSPSTFRMTINDEDKKWIERNPLSGQDEVTIVRDPAHLDKDDYEILTSSKKNQEKMLKCLKVNEEELIEMAGRTKAYLLLCYLTVRRFRAWEANPNNQELIIYNRQRAINCSFINEKDGSIQFISAIDIIPLPEEATVEFQYYRPAEEQSLIHIPFIDPQYLHAKIDQVLIDDPYAIIFQASNNSLPLINRFTSLSNGIYLQVANDIPYQSFKEYTVLMLIDVKKKQMLLGESRKNDRRQSRTKIQSRYVAESADDISGPKMISLNLRVWGCMKFTALVPLWSEHEGCISLPNEIFSSSNIKFFILASDDEDSLKFYQDKKNKAQNLQLLRVNEGEAKTQIYFSAFSHTPNDSYISVHAIDANQAITQEESLKSKEFIYAKPFYRLVMLMQSFIPNFKEMLKINVNKASMGVLEEPFVYRSSSNKKSEFKIHSSDASLVWVKNNDTIFQIQGKGQRKIHISFNTQKIIERNSLSGSCEGIVLGVRWDKGIDYYGFKFNIY